MFDTHDNAHEYKKNCKRNGQLPLPILVKEDGTSLVSSRQTAIVTLVFDIHPSFYVYSGRI